MFADFRDGTPMSARPARKFASPADCLSKSGCPDCLLAGLRVGSVRALGPQVSIDPPTGDPGRVWLAGKKTASRLKKLARLAQWVVPPTDP